MLAAGVKRVKHAQGIDAGRTFQHAPALDRAQSDVALTRAAYADSLRPIGDEAADRRFQALLAPFGHRPVPTPLRYILDCEETRPENTKMFDNALAGVRVLDLTHHVAGPQCTKLLGDYGADVIKVERPGAGDSARAMGPYPGDEPHPEKSGMFLHLNTSKRGITLDLKDPAGAQIAKDLAATADIVVENFRPGVMDRLGLGYDELEAINPAVVVASISNFGQTGPYRDLKSSDLVAYAMGGPMNITGHADREPLKLAGNIVAMHSGSVAAYASTLALFDAEDSGEGQHIDVSVYETQAGFRDRRVVWLTAHSYTGYLGSRPDPAVRVASGTRPCADGYVNILGFGPRFRNICEMIGHPELADHPVLSNPAGRSDPEAAYLFDEYYIPWLMEHTMLEAVTVAQEHHLLAGPINNVEDIFHDPHFAERGFWDPIEHPRAGELTYPGRPFKMYGAELPHRSPAPLLGQHTDEVLSELGRSAEDIAELRERGIV
jgi:crotonobetainyl-CoA:carnitine CoA-transferase CaiB-like acyl-CoA transferase|tara:strand:- start:3496 stop:4968 length:1473 start_codon:yes stop_codon:yes gene_type:complete